MLGARSALGLFMALNTFAQLWFSCDYGDDALDRNREGPEGGVVVYTPFCAGGRLIAALRRSEERAETQSPALE